MYTCYFEANNNRTKYGLFQDAVRLCNTKEVDRWKSAKFMVFDAPDIADKPYEERMQYLKDLKEQGSLPSFVNIIDTVKCEGKISL
jgi:hypothetical protein